MFTVLQSYGLVFTVLQCCHDVLFNRNGLSNKTVLSDIKTRCKFSWRNWSSVSQHRLAGDTLSQSVHIDEDELPGSVCVNSKRQIDQLHLCLRQHIHMLGHDEPLVTCSKIMPIKRRSLSSSGRRNTIRFARCKMSSKQPSRLV